jgi:hypothetical protein
MFLAANERCRFLKRFGARGIVRKPFSEINRRDETWRGNNVRVHNQTIDQEVVLSAVIPETE